MVAAVESCTNSFRDLTTRRLGDLRKQRNSHVPFLSLPSELQAYIIHLHIIPERHPNERLASLQLISWHWNELIKDDAQLWARIQFLSPSWKCAFTLSKDAPIDILVKGPSPKTQADFDTFVEKISSQTHRWRSARIAIPDLHPFVSALENPFPLLERLELNYNSSTTDTIAFQGGPRLRRLRAFRVNVNWDQAILSGLRELTFECLSVDGPTWGPKLRTLLESCPQLQKLRLFSITWNRIPAATSPPPPPPSTTPLVIPDLRHLDVNGVCPEVSRSIFPLAGSDRLHTIFLGFIGDREHQAVNDRVMDSLVRNGDRSLLRAIINRRKTPIIVVHINFSYTPPYMYLMESGPRNNIWLAIAAPNWKEEMRSLAVIVNDCGTDTQLQLTGPVGWIEESLVPEFSCLEEFKGTLKVIIPNQALGRSILRFLTEHEDAALGLGQIDFSFVDMANTEVSLSGTLRDLVVGFTAARPNIILNDKCGKPISL